MKWTEENNVGNEEDVDCNIILLLFTFIFEKFTEYFYYLFVSDEEKEKRFGCIWNVAM